MARRGDMDKLWGSGLPMLPSLIPDGKKKRTKLKLRRFYDIKIYKKYFHTIISFTSDSTYQTTYVERLQSMSILQDAHQNQRLFSSVFLQISSCLLMFILKYI